MIYPIQTNDTPPRTLFSSDEARLWLVREHNDANHAEGTPEFDAALVAYGCAEYQELIPTRLWLEAKAWEAIKAERERRRVGGVLVAGKWIHSDDPSRIQHLGLVLMGAGMPPNIQWKTMDGTFVTMTPDLAWQIFTALAAADMANFANGEQHRLAMKASADPAGYNYLSGWSPIYEGA